MSKVENFLHKLAGAGLKLPIFFYRYMLAWLAGGKCRHAPSCSEYAIEAIDLNGAWRGFWLTLSRFWRCRPGGTHGYDRRRIFAASITRFGLPGDMAGGVASIRSTCVLSESIKRRKVDLFFRIRATVRVLLDARCSRKPREPPDDFKDSPKSEICAY